MIFREARKHADVRAWPPDKDIADAEGELLQELDKIESKVVWETNSCKIRITNLSG